MLFELSVGWLVAVNVLAWLVIHLGVAWAGTRLPVRLFRPSFWPFRTRKWERGGFYETTFAVRRWKDRLPDGAALFAGGFRKASLRSASGPYLARFIAETCRGEAVHWVVLLSSALFFLWNPPAVGAVMVVYAILANLPCIIVQRYNRIRLRRITGALRGG
mgnify:CR=1 FL=1